MAKWKDQGFLVHWLRDLLCGTLIGAGAILPGVSGGVLAVVFDVYRPFMEVLIHPRAAIPKYWVWFPPIAVGWCIGFLGFAKGIAAAIRMSNTVTTWLFIGLIAGTVPALFREAGKEGRRASAWVSFVLCAGLSFLGLVYAGRLTGAVVEPNGWWYLLCGVLWGIGVVIPGLTFSSVLMALGLYQPLLEGLSSLDLTVLAASIPGMLLSIALLARAAAWLLEKHYAAAFHGILGFVLASTVVIIPTEYAPGEGVLSAACCVGGFLLAFLLARLDRRIKQ